MNKYSQYCGNKGSLMLIFVVSLHWNAQERLGRPMPEVPGEYLQRCLFIREIMPSMPSWQQIARGLYLAEQLHLWRWSSGHFDWEPCLASALSTCVWPCFPPKRMFDFSKVLKLWSSVQKSCVEAELLTFGTKSGSADVQRTKPSPRTFAWNARSCSWTARNQEPKSTRPVPCQITRAWTTRAARTNACRRQADAMPTSPTLWAKSRGYPIWRVLLSMYWFFHV